MWCRGVRGATLVPANTKEDILGATRELLDTMMASNRIEREAVACAFFTVTADLNAEFPALAARQTGWTGVPLMCGQEVDVPNSLHSCIRILILFNTDKKPEDIVHVYIRGAEALRPELES